MRRQKILSELKKKLPSVYWHQIAQNPRYYNTLLEISFFSLHPTAHPCQRFSDFIPESFIRIPFRDVKNIGKEVLVSEEET